MNLVQGLLGIIVRTVNFKIGKLVDNIAQREMSQDFVIHPYIPISDPPGKCNAVPRIISPALQDYSNCQY